MYHTLMQIGDYKYTDDLIAHTIEWIAYYIMQDFPIAAVCSPDKTPVKRFETDRWNFYASRVSYDYFLLLQELKVIQVVEGVDLVTHKASCSFSDIKKTARFNLHRLERTEGLDINTFVFKMFLRLAHLANLISKSENEYFRVEPFWEDMFDHLISHKLIKQVEDRYYWQELARPILEENCDWYRDRYSSVNAVAKALEPITWRWFG